MLIEFYCTILFPFRIKYYHIIFIIIVFRVGCDRSSGLIFFRARFAAFHTHASLLTFFICFFILFRSYCSHARVFGKALVHEFPIFCSHTEQYLLFSDSETTSAQCVFGAKNYNQLCTSKPIPFKLNYVQVSQPFPNWIRKKWTKNVNKNEINRMELAL